MTSRKTRVDIARQTVNILERGEYSLPDGATVSIADRLKAAQDGTVLYEPADFAGIFAQIDAPRGELATAFHIENSTTFAAAKRLTNRDNSLDPLCLNFASAKNPGGGFLRGNRAQEEDLARASGLYACIGPVSGYYDANRNCGTCLYTHNMIYSPKVPIFRDDDDQLLAAPHFVSIVTAPAVNAGAMRRNEPEKMALIETMMLERIERILSVAVLHRHSTIILGAWGCGVFKNDPADVARWFYKQLVENVRFHHAFSDIVFAVLDRSNRPQTYSSFARQFSAAPNGA